MISKVWLKQQLVFKVVIIAMYCAIPTFAAAQPATNVADKILRDVRTGKISTAEGKRRCLSVIEYPANLPQKIEAALVLVKLSHGNDPPDLNEEYKERRLNRYRQALAVALPILDGLGDAHRQSFPALGLNVEVCKIIPSIAYSTENTTESLTLMSRSLACLETVLDAGDDLLIPPDKVLAEDEDLELEQIWVKGQLKLLKEQAAVKIIRCCYANDSDVYISTRQNITRIMEKYPNVNKLQEEGAKRLTRINERLMQNLLNTLKEVLSQKE
jgi:hypothetical protein